MRIQAGASLSVPGADRWYDYIRAGQAGACGTQIVPTVGQRAHVQLFNPVGSGKIVLVKNVITSLNTSGVILAGTHNTALTGASTAAVNLLNGGPALSALAKVESVAGVSGTVPEAFLVPSSIPFATHPNWSYELGAGEGMILVSFAVTLQLVANWQFVEFPA